ncbi:hypothetical protein CcCBS67573_g05273 [Chytriomyces confervae]|uniref:Elongator complex protein 5 n=1 Tax=Chytriomyces confervae TaxID=246404 RepID=A0A507FDU8_9FUNG|nr:hypothetical protein CcCBS67573_g05273 [Chytriomyces confervae]
MATVSIVHCSTATRRNVGAVVNHICGPLATGSSVTVPFDPNHSPSISELLTLASVENSIKSMSAANTSAAASSSPPSVVIVDAIPNALVLPKTSIALVLQRLRDLIDTVSVWKFRKTFSPLAGHAKHVILINNTCLEPLESQFSFRDLLDTLASQVFAIGDPDAAGESVLWQDGWVLVDSFLLRASNTGTFGRIRKGSVKERIGLKLNGRKMTVKSVSDLLLEFETRPDASIVVSATAAAAVTTAAPTSVAQPQSDRNDPTSNLSFNLKLTDEQREMREATVLPYVHDGTISVGGGISAGGFIHYQADAMDDDEGDPDDDLAL